MEQKIIKFQLRQDSAENWNTNNPILDIGEPGYDITNKIFKIGDGVTAWNNLPNQNATISSISVNNIAQSVVDKNVNITVPTKNSELTNDSNFITDSVDTLTNYYINTVTDEKLENKLDKLTASNVGLYSHNGDTQTETTLGTGLNLNNNILNVGGVSYLTIAPSSDNTSGDLKFVVLDSEPETYYNGYYYIITQQ